MQPVPRSHDALPPLEELVVAPDRQPFFDAPEPMILQAIEADESVAFEAAPEDAPEPLRVAILEADPEASSIEALVPDFRPREPQPGLRGWLRRLRG